MFGMYCDCIVFINSSEQEVIDMSKSRFVRKWKSSGQYIFDNKTEECFHNIVADDVTLREVCRLLNALDRKNMLAQERIENQCEIIRELKQELKKHDCG